MIMPVHEQLPRLTESIRSFGSISRPPNRYDELSEESNYQMQREMLIQAEQRNSLPSIAELRFALSECCKSGNLTEKDVNGRLRQILNVARDVTGMEWSADMVESVGMYLLQMFYDSYYLNQMPGVTIDHKNKLIDMFGPQNVTNQCVNNAYEHTKSILQLLDEEERERLFNPSNNSKFVKKKLKPFEMMRENEWANGDDFGVDLFGCWLPHEDASVIWDSFSNGEHVNGNASKIDRFNFEYKGNSVSNVDKSGNKGVHKISLEQRRDMEWLNRELTSFIDNYSNSHDEPFYLPFEILSETILEWLQAKDKSDDELAADLNNILGDTSLNLIQDIVKNRLNVIQSFNKLCQEDIVPEESRRIQLLKDIKTHSNIWDKQPVYAQSVVVHTVEEKNLKKQLRKAEKKMMKEINREGGHDINNINEIGRQKEHQEKLLLNAMYSPLFKESTPAILDPTEFPYVFDSYAEAKASSAFIAGSKMTLPIGFERKDTRRWEEISIPAPQPPPAHMIGQFKLISIKEDLDEFGRMAFQGIEKLNRIQSIVYNTAYFSNTNMLICAPTGAGKTNVAMLAILHEMKCNARNAHDIDLDRFKIVYIAPMKALAAEMTENFSNRLKPYGIRVRELTGDMQLTKSEIMATQILVTTPEKWDVVTRKSKGDVQLLQLVRLLIIDEVHLLQSDRGPVLEALVARTKRYVESTQTMIRIIGLSATLPNYKDVADFLRVSPREGLFVFDNRFRPVPLSQTFIGCKATQTMQQNHDMDDVTYEKVYEMVSKGHQVMVFVHARNATFRTATIMKDKASKQGHLNVFQSEPDKLIGSEQLMTKARNKQLLELFDRGFAIHHAGMLRMDRNLVEKLFKHGVIKVLVCTSTLAWGVNLPAHSVIIRGTEMYDSSHGTYVDISMLDVMQIFGRAGRPQYDTEGHGVIITTHNKISHYLSMLTCQYPIESNFRKYLTDNMNAEIAAGTISTIDEAVEWLGYSYLYIRMIKNPLVYGIEFDYYKEDSDLYNFREKLVRESAELLDRAKMIRYNPENGTLDATDLGRTSSHFYIKYDTVEVFNELINENEYMNDADAISMISQAQEFDQLRSREEEQEELLELQRRACKLKVPKTPDDRNSKVNILMQAYLSKTRIESFSLISDSMFIMQNVTRIARGLFEYLMKKGNAFMANNLLRISLMFEKQQWDHETPLRQFQRDIPFEVMQKIERNKLDMDKIYNDEITADEIGRLVRHQKYGDIIIKLSRTLPYLDIEPVLKPITRTVLQVHLSLTPNFYWDDRYHGKVCESFWIWIEEPDSNHIYHSELFKVLKKQAITKAKQTLIFNIPLLDSESVPGQYIVHAASDRWLGCNYSIPISCHNLILPEKYLPYTKLLDLHPLPVTALNNELFQSIYRFSHFNPIQTQIFHTLYHTDSNVLLGAPTGSGKTIAAEIAMLRVFSTYPNIKTVYIAPMKALVRERVDDWKIKIERNLGKRVVELTGDVMPDRRAIIESDVIVTTPEKWDGVSRSWQMRQYVRDVGLVIIDEIHLLGEDRGPVLEVIVSRANFISATTGHKLRIIGLSTAIANAQDLASWLDIRNVGLYNFKPSVRPVPLQVHVHGYPGKNYCPRMALMNKPVFRAIQQHSPDKPVLVFVSSRRQTRLTALDLISFVASSGGQSPWLKMDSSEMNYLITQVKDENLKLSLEFGIGLHHAGLHEKDRSLVEELFSNQKIQILIATATLAWGVNLPAHAVIIKGTEFFDGKLHRYVDFPITDVLQMMGRAGRPQFDTSGVAVILVHDVKKEYYKKFLYEPFPVESSLLGVLPDHLNAEIVTSTLKTKQDCLQYLSWTYLFRRILKNPAYYGLNSSEEGQVNTFLSIVIDNALQELVDNLCLSIDDDDRSLNPTVLGRIASYYYLHHTTVKAFNDHLNAKNDFASLLNILSNAHEYAELPVRHNEDSLNLELATKCPIKLSGASFDSPHVKANLLLQCHISRLQLPCTDYFTDLKSVLDQAIRVIQAMIDVAANSGFLTTTIKIIVLQQMIVQARWQHENSLLTIACINENMIQSFSSQLSSLELLLASAMQPNGQAKLKSALQSLSDMTFEQLYQTLLKLPFIHPKLYISKVFNDDEQSNSEDNSGNNIEIALDPKSNLTPSSQRQWIQVFASSEYMITCMFARTGNTPSGNNPFSTKAIAPKFPKHKDEGWVVIVGEAEKNELLALKRIGHIRHNCSQQQRSNKSHSSIAQTQKVTFKTPIKPGKVIYTFYLMSDSYLGLDQQYDICLDVKELPPNVPSSHISFNEMEQ